ncbi:NAD synthetase [Pseudomonas sp. BIGb0427]|uniref:NAD synthetase n=1 Tax=unclassified Pseudomonas TaxID=196821 RepID=UPI0016B40D69|nr:MULTISPECIES: NAD synthetase [unclassified Pseudomonas]NLU59759.1 NAD synthetase [Pseudomonas sp. BIGb0427]QPG64187.1 NAD synthetase [Pseudomonas sp. BIGb0427]UVM66615.1 NAD synthetase [Pseudomonas sp. B21-009]
MSELLNRLDNNPSQFFARQRIESSINLPKLFAAIDADPGIVGAGVVYIDADYNVVTLREFQPICSVLPKRVILREAKKYLAPAQFADQLQNNPREARVVKEAVNTTLACASAILGWFVMVSGTIAVPFSGGLGAVVAIAGKAAIAAGAMQCMIGVARTGQEIIDPSLNDELDAQEWFRHTSNVLDAVSLMGVGASGLTTVKFLQMRKAATGSSWYELSRSLSRQQRKALTTELLSIKHPSLTAKQLKLQQSAGALPKRYTPTQLQHATKTLIKDSIAATFGFAGSNTVQTIAVGLYEELE